MGALLGIDLGTTNSCAAVLTGGEPAVVVNAEGERTTPSVIAIGRGGERLVGNPAKRQAIVNPSNTIYSVKRFIGRKFSHASVKGNVQRFPFQIVEESNGDVRFVVDGKRYSPEELSAMVLCKFRVEAEEFLGEKVEDAVITVPAYFDERQRSATRDAGKIAGLNVLRIINEPTAAALAYGLNQKTSGTIAVFDLGGGTFDISIMKIDSGQFRVLATSGNSFLGGDDFDERIIDWVVQEFESRHGVKLPRDPTVLQRLKNAAEGAKKDLSFSQVTSLTIPFITSGPTGPLHLDVEFLRAQFENLVGDLVQATVPPCQQALDDAGLRAEQIDAVILVGGQTRSPVVQRKVEELFGKVPLKGINPDEAVALGAVITGGIATGKIEEVTLQDVTPLSLGIETLGGVFTPVIPRNTSLPASVEKIFTTTDDNQLIIRIHVLQGEREMAAGNRTLGLFDLVGVRPSPKGVPKIAISFQINADGILHVEARDEDTGRKQRVQIEEAGGLSSAQIQRMLEEAQKYYDEDAKRRNLVTARNQAVSLLYSVQRILTDAGDALDDGFEEVLKDSSDKLRKTSENALDPKEVESAVGALLECLKQIRYKDATASS